jgi:hypothetical protein
MSADDYADFGPDLVENALPATFADEDQDMIPPVCNWAQNAAQNVQADRRRRGRPCR